MMPFSRSGMITFSTSFSDTLSLLPDGPQPSGTVGSCPLAAKTGRVPALSNEDLPIQVAVYDSKGRKFDNFSADALTWSLSERNNDGGGAGARLKLDKGIQYASVKYG